ncbi:hypothetical protein GOEFS_106_01090 [Gordonia effusa NBRC 100432]|uniref:Helix-turn-helix domain-containing protein n=1 Tax=Gordonia effusa NBRC 100432 TaxID=1077974 RepID=H0R560_9ACTN|nr:helix-turn-helix domain-containing protein [Gordonia effusa]GAB20211.1 hypothetical protein GOEFS_106_01090 [Gordonia effusa NBRC 100432]
MATFTTSGVPAEQIDQLGVFAAKSAGPELRELLEGLIPCLRAGDGLQTVDPDKPFTPNEAAQRLGVSRTHLYKLLDKGEILFHNVGRDRRIALRDLVAFEQQRQNDRRELAERFAARDSTRRGAIDDIAAAL